AFKTRGSTCSPRSCRSSSATAVSSASGMGKVGDRLTPACRTSARSCWRSSGRSKRWLAAPPRNRWYAAHSSSNVSHGCSTRAVDKRGQEQLETDQFDGLVPDQVAVLPQVARARFDRAAVFGAAPELGQGRQRRQGAQDAVVLVAHAATPAAVR